MTRSQASIVTLSFLLLGITAATHASRSSGSGASLSLQPCTVASLFTHNSTSLQLMVDSLCVTYDLQPATDNNTFLAACNATDPRQRWHFDPGANTSIVFAGDTTNNTCLNIKGYATMPASEAWTTTNCYACHANCAFQWSGSIQANNTLVNPAAQLCLSTPAPPLPTTCGPGSPAANMSFCNRSLTFEERAALLTAALTTEEKLAIWSPDMPTQSISRLNLKSYMWDATCIHGPAPYHVNPAPNVTVTAHAINLGASFDLDLVQRVSNMTMVEMRAVTQLYYQKSSGTAVLALGCDGGPLANQAIDPRWGRISETYGEDPYLVSRMGTVATLAMQQQTTRNNRTYIATSQTIRHYMGRHGSNLMPLPAMNISEVDLQQTYLLPYQSMMVAEELSWTGDRGGNAEAIMCGYAAFNGIPSCASTRLLQTILRQTWQTTALVQSDCCDSITSIYDLHHYVPNLEQAVRVAVQAGTQLQYTSAPTSGRAAFAQALADGNLTSTDLDQAVARILLTRLKLGEFDDDASPFGSVGGDQWLPYLNSPQHRALARETAAASIVMLKNAAGILPLQPQRYRRVVILGPFANNPQELLHSYNGVPSNITTPWAALQTWFAQHSPTTQLQYFPGCGVMTNTSSSDFLAAVNASRSADLIIAVLGLGSEVEAESHDRGEGHGSDFGLGLPTVQQQLLSAVRQSNAASPLLLALMSAGGVSLANVSEPDAILWLGYGGEEGGSGMVDVVSGSVCPSARLPVTWYAPDYLDKVGPELDYSMTSGVGRSYRYLNETPQFSFGHGLSYSRFSSANLHVEAIEQSPPTYNVSVTVTNQGTVDCATVAQLYVQPPNYSAAGVVKLPSWQLQGFQKVTLAAGQQVSISFVLRPLQLSAVLGDGQWYLLPGLYRIAVGDGLPTDPAPTAVPQVMAMSIINGTSPIPTVRF